ncbi:MAG: coiled coil domain-containing protein [Pseudomonadota bacterium]
MKDTRKEYEDKIEAHLKEWNEQIVLLKAKAEDARAEAKTEYLKTIEALRHKQDEAETRLDKLKTAGDGAWEDIKIGAEKVWDDVREAFHNAVSKFK